MSKNNNSSCLSAFGGCLLSGALAIGGFSAFYYGARQLAGWVGLGIHDAIVKANDARLNTPGHDIHDIQVQKITYLRHEIFKEDEASCPRLENIEVKDETGTVISRTLFVDGAKNRVRVRPIVLNCFYSFQLKNIAERKSYSISYLGNYSLRQMKESNWKISIGAVDTTIR